MSTTTTTTMNARPPTVGQKAPDFDLITYQGPNYKLSEALKNGPVIVAFLPGAFTGVCTKEACAFTNEWKEYEKLGTQFVGVSVDSKHAQRGFVEANKLTLQLASDMDRKTVTAYGIAWNSPWGPTCKRSIFLLDRSGTVRYSWISEDAGKEPVYAEIKAALKGLK